MVYVGNNRVAKNKGCDMRIFVYVSDATERTIITGTDHGKAWEQKDGEVFDLLGTTDLSANIIVCDGRLSSGCICTEKDLGDTILA